MIKQEVQPFWKNWTDVINIVILTNSTSNCNLIFPSNVTDYIYLYFEKAIAFLAPCARLECGQMEALSLKLLLSAS